MVNEHFCLCHHHERYTADRISSKMPPFRRDSWCTFGTLILSMEQPNQFSRYVCETKLELTAGNILKITNQRVLDQLPQHHSSIVHLNYNPLSRPIPVLLHSQGNYMLTWQSVLRHLIQTSPSSNGSLINETTWNFLLKLWMAKPESICLNSTILLQQSTLLTISFLLPIKLKKLQLLISTVPNYSKSFIHPDFINSLSKTL